MSKIINIKKANTSRIQSGVDATPIGWTHSSKSIRKIMANTVIVDGLTVLTFEDADDGSMPDDNIVSAVDYSAISRDSYAAITATSIETGSKSAFRLNTAVELAIARFMGSPNLLGMSTRLDELKEWVLFRCRLCKRGCAVRPMENSRTKRIASTVAIGMEVSSPMAQGCRSCISSTPRGVDTSSDSPSLSAAIADLFGNKR